MNQLPAISENKAIRIFMLFILYAAQGLPIGLFLFAIPAWMAESGASVAQIGSFSFLATLPWTLKFVNGFFLDRYVYLPMGRRRAWLLGALFMLVILMLLMAIVDPGPSELVLLSSLAFVIMFATTYQDTAIDGMAADLVPPDERTAASGVMFGGQLIGIALGSALTGYLIVSSGFATSVFVMATLIGVVLLAVLLIRERPNEKILPWLPGEASEHSKMNQAANFKEIVSTVGKAIVKTDSLKLISVMLLSSICYGLYTSGMPKMASDLAGWTTEDYSSLSGTANLIAGFLCVFVFGLLANRIGRKKIILFLLIVQCILVGWALLDHEIWSADDFVNTAGISVISIKYGLSVALAAIAMGLCNLKVSATQFTLYMAFSNLGLSIAYALAGSLDRIGGYLAIMIAFACVSTLALIIAATLDENSPQSYRSDP